VTRIPELEQELVAAAARLKSPRRVLRPALRASLAAAAAALVVVLVVLLADGNDGDQGSRPAGALPSAPGDDVNVPDQAFVPERQRIARTANRWVRLFIRSDLADCRYMSQPACERLHCVRVGPRPIPNCTPPSPAFRLSFVRAGVEDVETKGYRAAARFSNGEVVELERVSGNDLDGVWLITRWGRNAGRGFFE
jgi:hypothetical protein